MTISEERRGAIGILKPKGSFETRAEVTLFEEAVFRLLKDNITLIVLDLGAVKYVNSAAFGVMISTMVSVGRRDGALRLAALQKEVLRIVKIMHLDHVFEVYETVDQAVTSFGRRSKS